MATGQYLTEVGLQLVQQGHRVTVVTGLRAYDDPKRVFPRRETWRGIEIHRIGSTGLGKGAKWRRAVDFASFLLRCAIRCVALPRHDALVTLTSPPLISFLGALLAGLRGSQFYYWVMDLNPDEAMEAGWLRRDSVAGRVLESISKFSFRRAKRIIALDRFMKERIKAKGIPADRIAVIPPWSHDDDVRFDADRRELFRCQHGFADKFVVMYSGNHSPCHPLDTLLEAARRLVGRLDILFLFVGGGSEWRKIRERIKVSEQPNVRCLPYQPLDQLSGSLSAADVHVVVMGNSFVGTVHPCKIYNILNVQAPMLYIGPRPSHATEIIDAIADDSVTGCAEHGEVDRVVSHVLRLQLSASRRNADRYRKVRERFSKSVQLRDLVGAIETH